MFIHTGSADGQESMESICYGVELQDYSSIV